MDFRTAVAADGELASGERLAPPLYHRMVVVVVALKKPGQFYVEKVQQSAFYFLEECLLSSQFIDLVHFTHSCVSYFKQLVWCVTFIAHKS